MINSKIKIFNNINKDLFLLANSYKKNHFTPLLSSKSGNFDKGIGKYRNLYYKFDAKKNYIEFTHGRADPNLSNFLNDNFYVKRAHIIKFDSKVDVSHVTNMACMFFCLQPNHIDRIIFPDNFDTSNVVSMCGMFGYCGLSQLHLPKSFDTSKVTDMTDMFSNNNFQTLILPNSFDTSNVKHMMNMFGNDSALHKLKLPKAFNTSKVKDMFGMFCFTESLRSLRLPKHFNMEHVSDMAFMFDVCGLTSITLTNPKNLKFPPENEMQQSFGDDFRFPWWFKNAYKSLGNGYTSTHGINLITNHITGTFCKNWHRKPHKNFHKKEKHSYLKQCLDLFKNLF